VYGLRIEWTLIGDGQKNLPNESDRYALVDRFLAMSQGREEKIMHFEIANEAWQNGFEGDEGIAQLRALSSYMKDNTDILVAASAPAGVTCEEYELVYGGGVADLATIHFDRNNWFVDGAWRPVRQPWELEYCGDVPVGSNNEPIGPGASVAEENDPQKLVAAALATYVSNLPLYVFHTRAGIRGDFDIWDMPGIASFVHVSALLPPDLSSWTRQNAHWATSPFRVYSTDSSGALHGDEMWPDLADPIGGAVRVYSDTNGGAFFSLPFGILGTLVLEARNDCTFDVFDPMTGNLVSSHTLLAGEQVELAGYEVLVIKGVQI
jgi:hypothetical protein